MGFFSSIKRLWSSNKTAETPETPQAPAEEALAAQPAETEDGASHEESSVSGSFSKTSTGDCGASETEDSS